MSQKYTYWAGISTHMTGKKYEVFFPEFSDPLIAWGDTEEEALSNATEMLKARLKKLRDEEKVFPAHQIEFPVDLNSSMHTIPKEITVTIE